MTRHSISRRYLMSLLAASLAACGGGSSGSSGSSSTGAVAVTSAGTSGASGGSSGNGSGNGSSGGATTGNGTTGTTTGLPSCAPGAVWNGSICQLSACAPKLAGAGCTLGDAGSGECYGTACIDVSSDSSHCGSPEVACAVGLVCDAGSCVGSVGCSDAGGCPAGTQCQPGGRECLPTGCDSDAGQRTCANGICCGSVCSDLTDTSNCGVCGSACGPGAFCGLDAATQNLKCETCASVPDNTPCGGGFCCNGTCQPAANSDDQNCGRCGFGCPPGGACTNGSCSGSCDANCPAGQVCVGSAQTGGFGCIDTSCPAGHDGTECGVGGTCCGTTCIENFSSDPQNCGGCGVQCGSAQVCRAGVCVAPRSCLFSAPGTQCMLEGGGQGVCCSGSCTDLSSNAGNCGACGQGCSTGTTCTSGLCVGACVDSTDCVVGATCIQGLCQASCSSRQDGDQCSTAVDAGGSPFVFAGTCCGGQCVGGGDNANCGGCGRACPPGLGCFGSGCTLPSSAPFVCGGSGQVSCPRGQGCASNGAVAGDACAPQDCSHRSNGDACSYGPNEPGQCCASECVSISSDPSNCGSCGISCPSATCEQGICQPAKNPQCSPICGAGLSCIDGACVNSLCTGSTCVTQSGVGGACCANGACVDLQSDPANCGGCGRGCPSGESCASGACQGDTCSLSTEGIYCGLPDPGAGCCGNACVDVTTDASNCGGCGKTCQPAQTCRNGNCG